MNLRIEFEAVWALGNRDQNIQTNPRIEQCGDIGWRAVRQLCAESGAEFYKAQGAAIEMLAQRVQLRPVFGKCTEDALGVDHGEAVYTKEPIVLHGLVEG
ncbi:hypothetical protein GCM10009425_27870 [Pseudomonas asuensis]|uniref:Uncharacterized protein n=1 Tax=Pseudomonas asuensis TaxID=1825787 RepID=A0ABQ2GWF5_9PSED|nr:hypothetical protein GCM10009425_27870 [Pseudomonas asuensis]